MLNHIVLQGRVTRDPELRRTAAGVAVASFTLAVDRDYTPAGNEKETDFIDIVVWRTTAEFVARNFSKGRMVVVSGRLRIRNWTDKEGNKRRSAEVIADGVYFSDSKRDATDNNVGNKADSYGGQTSPGNSYGNPYGGSYGNYGSGSQGDYPIFPPYDEDGALPY